MQLLAQKILIRLRKLTSEDKLVIGLLILSSFFRLWNIPNSLQFLGDQGRDAIVVSRIFTQLDPVFIGPVTSVGNMYLGPLYYYFMMPFLFLTYPSPLGPVYAIAFLSILTVGLVYFWGKQLVGTRAALLAATLLTFSHTAILYSRFSWNPNPAPLVSLAMVYFTYKAWKKSVWYWVGVSLCFSILIQLHYVYLLSAGGAGIIWLVQLIKLFRKPHRKGFSVQSFLFSSLVGLALFLLSLTPLMLFDSRHNWLNANAFTDIIFKTSDNSIAPEGQSLLKVVLETHGRSMHILFEWLIGQERLLNTILVVITLVTFTFTSWKRRLKQPGLLILLAYLMIGIIGTSFYQHTVFNHYIAYLFPVAVLVLGVVLDQFLKLRFGSVVVGVFLAGFILFNIPRIPIQDTGWTVNDMQRTADTIYQRVEAGEKYNIVLMAETGDIDGQNYRYFLTTTDKPPVKTEDRGSVETLFIIDEEKKLDDVTASPIYEIVVFPNKNPTEVYTIEGGPQITVLSTKQ